MIIKTLLLLVMAFRLSAQQFSPAPFLGAGGASVAQDGIFALQDNPAGLTSLKRLAAGSAFQQHFVGTDIASQAFYLAIPVFSGSWLGFTVTNYGVFELSSLMRSGASFVRSFGHFSASVGVNYHQFAVHSYQSERQFSGDLGFQFRGIDHLSLGLFWRNIAQAKFSTLVDQRIVQEVGVGALAQVTSQLEAVVDVWREHPETWRYRSGLIYRFSEQFCLRGGFASSPFQYTGGVGFMKGKWAFDLASAFHVTLGSSPQLALSYAF
ncbi:hypothetical protein [Sphingobacterium bambusae]|uniref:PorV/PorQ family protein n=2 Tax=Sphingobacterium bambusae TaxID=662858 RepID=A0ABW6BJ75_9SPHI